MLTMTKTREVICSAGKGVLSAADCLQCAIDAPLHHPDCGFDYGLLKALLDRQDRPDIHVTDLTGCLLRAYLTKTDPKPEYVHSMLYVVMGSALHGHLEDSDAYVDCELPLAADGVVGTADVVYKDGRVVDIKTTRWMYPSKLPYGSHVLQLNIYANMLRKMGREVTSLAIMYVDLSGPTKCRACRRPVVPGLFGLECPSCGDTPKNAHIGGMLFEAPLWGEEEIESHITARRDALRAALDGGDPPPGEPSFLCNYCAFQDTCPDAQH